MKKVNIKIGAILSFALISMAVVGSNFSTKAQDIGPIAFSIGAGIPVYDNCNKLVTSKLPSANITDAYFVFGSNHVRVDAKVKTYSDAGYPMIEGYTDTAVFFFPPNGYQGVDYSSIDWSTEIEDRSALIYTADGVEYRYDGIYFEYPGYGEPQCENLLYENGVVTEPFPIEEYDSWFPMPTGNGELIIPEGTFPDITGNTFETYITNLSDAGIVGGYKDGTYKPDNDVNRGQLAKFVKLAFNIETDTSCGAFSDVQPGHTFYEHVTTLKCAGIIGGYKDGTYKPDNGVTRGQVTKFITNAMDDKGIIVDMTVEPSFSDVASSNGFYPYIGFLSSVEVSGTKVIKGYPDGTYKPDVILTRGQMSKIVDIARQAD